MPDAITVRAYAKINLCLDVLGRRPDGLHEVRTVLQTVSLADRLAFRASDELRLHIRGMPSTSDNLILRAAQLVRPFARGNPGCDIRCEKRIPIGAGLGGGSADAAATLQALNRLWSCGLDRLALQELAGKLGADAPFLVEGGTALATGSGRDLVSLPDAPRPWLVLAAVESETETKTGEMYAALQPSDYRDGSRAWRMAETIRAGTLDYSSVGNSFGRLGLERWEASRVGLALIDRCGPRASAVTGAGPSVFGLFDTRPAAITALRVLRAHGQRAHLLQFITGQDRRSGSPADGRARATGE
jgi:4-diphosphocytidyl-2-C-methyl-D-erythritol kinase